MKQTQSLTDNDIQDHAIQLRDMYDYDLHDDDSPTWDLGNQLIQRFRRTFEG